MDFHTESDELPAELAVKMALHMLIRPLEGAKKCQLAGTLSTAIKSIGKVGSPLTADQATYLAGVLVEHAPTSQQACNACSREAGVAVRAIRAAIQVVNAVAQKREVGAWIHVADVALLAGAAMSFAMDRSQARDAATLGHKDSRADKEYVFEWASENSALNEYPSLEAMANELSAVTADSKPKHVNSKRATIRRWLTEWRKLNPKS